MNGKAAVNSEERRELATGMRRIEREKKKSKNVDRRAEGAVDLFLEGGSHRRARHNDNDDDANDDDDDGSSGFQANKKITPSHETRRRIKRR